MIDRNLVHSNEIQSGSRYASKFDYIMHNFCIQKFKSRIQNKSIIELGCYHGENTKNLAAQCSRVLAVDNDSECIKRTKKNCKNLKNVSTIMSSFEEFDGYSNYQVIYFSHALEHVRDDKGLLNSIYTKMSKNQELIVIVPNAMSLSRQIAVEMGIVQSTNSVTEFEKKIGHYRTYDNSMLQKIFTDIGFKILEDGGIMPKIFSNNQFDKAISEGIIDLNYIEALNKLSGKYKDICSSIYIIAKKD